MFNINELLNKNISYEQNVYIKHIEKFVINNESKVSNIMSDNYNEFKQICSIIYYDFIRINDISIFKTLLRFYIILIKLYFINEEDEKIEKHINKYDNCFSDNNYYIINYINDKEIVPYIIELNKQISMYSTIYMYNTTQNTNHILNIIIRYFENKYCSNIKIQEHDYNLMLKTINEMINNKLLEDGVYITSSDYIALFKYLLSYSVFTFDNMSYSKLIYYNKQYINILNYLENSHYKFLFNTDEYSKFNIDILKSIVYYIKLLSYYTKHIAYKDEENYKEFIMLLYSIIRKFFKIMNYYFCEKTDINYKIDSKIKILKYYDKYLSDSSLMFNKNKINENIDIIDSMYINQQNKILKEYLNTNINDIEEKDYEKIISKYDNLYNLYNKHYYNYNNMYYSVMILKECYNIFKNITFDYADEYYYIDIFNDYSSALLQYLPILKEIHENDYDELICFVYYGFLEKYLYKIVDELVKGKKCNATVMISILNFNYKLLYYHDEINNQNMYMIENIPMVLLRYKNNFIYDYNGYDYKYYYNKALERCLFIHEKLLHGLYDNKEFEETINKYMFK